MRPVNSTATPREAASGQMVGRGSTPRSSASRSRGPGGAAGGGGGGGGQGQHAQFGGLRVRGAGRVGGRDAGQAAQGHGPRLAGAAPLALLLDQDQAGETRPGTQQQQGDRAQPLVTGEPVRDPRPDAAD